jgi:hypothetical protein
MVRVFVAKNCDSFECFLEVDLFVKEFIVECVSDDGSISIVVDIQLHTFNSQV